MLFTTTSVKKVPSKWIYYDSRYVFKIVSRWSIWSECL